MNEKTFKNRWNEITAKHKLVFINNIPIRCNDYLVEKGIITLYISNHIWISYFDLEDVTQIRGW